MSNEITKAVQTRATRLLELICEIKSNPWQKPAQLWASLGISRSQFFEDKKSLAQTGFVFDYDRKQGRYVIKKDKYLPVSVSLRQIGLTSYLMRQVCSLKVNVSLHHQFS